MNNKIKKISLWVLTAVLLGTILGATATPFVNQNRALAAPADSADLDTQVKSYLYYMALSACMSQNSLADGATGSYIAPDDAVNGSWFLSTTAVRVSGNAESVNIGQYINNDSGQVACSDQNFISSALSLWGWTSKTQALCDFGFVRDTQSPGVTGCVNGSGNFAAPNGRDAMTTTMKEAIENKFYGHRGQPGLSPAMNYLLNAKTFEIGCHATVVGPYATATADQQTTSRSNNGYVLNVLDANGNVVPTIFTGDGWGERIAESVNPDGSTGENDCITLVGNANNYATAYANYIKAHPNDSSAPGGANAVGSGNNGGGSGTTTDNCPMGDGALRWVLCPIFDIAAKTLGALDSAIQSLLNVDINTVFSPDFEQVFGSIRQISISLIVVAGLIMVISQAAGLELLSAYTIRKLLPRLAIAVIGMAIAWPLLKFIVGFVNDLGNWIQLILLHVAQATPATQGQNNSLFESIISVPLGLAGGAAVALVAWGILGTGGIFAILGMAILALLVGFLVLTIRQIVIILCVILAPIAIASAVIPGTQRLWQFWRSTFTSTLLMFPIIMGFLGAGKAIAYLIGKSGPTGNGTLQVMAIFMYLAPYFMLPFAFRMAGGLMANVSGMVQNRAQAPRQWLTKRRQASSEAMAARRRSGNLYKNAPPGSFRGRINRGVAVGSNLGALGFDPRNWRANARSTFGNTQVFEEASEALQKNGHLAAVLQDGTLLASGMTTARFADGSRSRGTMADIRRYLSEKGQEGDVLDDNVAAVWAARQSMSTEAYDVAATIGRTATGTDWEDTGEFYRTVAEASHGNAALAAQLYGASRSAATKANQLEIGGVGFRTGLEQVNRAFNGEAVDVDKTLLDVANTNEAVNISRSRKAGVEKVANAVAANVTRLNSDLPDLTPDEAQELGKQTKVLDALQFYGDNYSAPDRQVIINTAAESAEHATINVHQVIDEASQEPVTYDIHTRARVQGEPNAPPTNIAKGFGRRLQPPQTNTNGPRDPNNPPPAP